MNRIGRWTQTVVARIDHMVTQVENHESLAESALRDVQQSFARAKVRLERVRRDGHRLEQRLRAARSDQQRWRERALRTADSSEASALECLRRSKENSRLADELELRLTEHRAAETQLQSDVSRVESRLRELREKRNLLRTRQSRAEAMSAARAADPTCDGRLEDVFERWEERITTIELDDETPIAASIDGFELQFRESEQTDDLKAELTALRKEARGENATRATSPTAGAEASTEEASEAADSPVAGSEARPDPSANDSDQGS